MSEAEWKTIRIRLKSVAKIDELRAANSASRVPSKTSRADMVDAMIAAYEESLGTVALAAAELARVDDPAPVGKRKSRR